MKITLESTTRTPHNSATISIANDELNIEEVWDDLIRPALIGYGFAKETVDSLRDKDC